MAGCRFGTLGTVVPASGAAHQTVMYWQFQLYYCLRQCERPSSDSCCSDSSGSCSGFFSGSGSPSVGGYIVPSTAATARAFSWREMTSFFFIAASSDMSLVTVVVSCTMAARSLVVDVARFEMASTVSCWSYPSSGFSVALCAAP